MRKPVYFGIITFFIALLSSISLIILVNIMIRNNVYNEARYTLENNVIEFTEVFDTEAYDSKEVPIVFNIITDDKSHMLIRFIDTRLLPTDLLYDDEVNLLNLVNSNSFNSDTTYEKDFGSGKIFFSIVNETTVLYINTSEYFYILKSLNQIFLAVTAIILIISVFIGFKVGRRIESSDEQLKRFFNNASHELKTPLTSIQGYTESIYLDITPDVKGSCKIVLKQCELMEKLIEELLLLSKLDSKAVRLDCIQINIYEVIDRLITYIKPNFDKHNIELICNFDGDEGMTCCDEKYIYHVFNTIISNSLRFAKSRVEISTKISNSAITITIYDDGEGFLEEDLPHIFKRFYAGKNGMSGIGLSLAKEIVRLHKGEISAKNNNGAEIVITMPKK